MKIEKLPIPQDDGFFHGWPDVALLQDGRLLAVYNECNAHCDRRHSRIQLLESRDRGRSWSAPRPLTPPGDGTGWYYNCPRIQLLRDGTLAFVVDRIPLKPGYALYEGNDAIANAEVLWARSRDGGATWSDLAPLPLHGIVPSRLLETASRRMLLAAHHPVDGRNAEFCIASDDGGRTWSAPVPFPLPCCHRPVAEWLQDGRILVTFRLYHGGIDGQQNFFGALTDAESLTAPDRGGARARIFPIDWDSSVPGDLGYSGWAQFSDGEIFILTYIHDGAPKARLRGYSLTL
jgi:sialidase-1